MAVTIIVPIIVSVLSVIAAYLIGSINSSILISKAVSGKDIRESGSGNAGATNMLRTMGKKYAVITLVIDIIKGVAAVLLARAAVAFGAYEQCVYLAGLAVCAGHCFPVFFGFRGGKGVATGLGVLFMWNWQTALIVLAVALIIMAATRYVSLGSIIAAVLFAVLETINLRGNAVGIACVIAVAAHLVWEHRGNIASLAKGEENKLGAKKK